MSMDDCFLTFVSALFTSMSINKTSECSSATGGVFLFCIKETGLFSGEKFKEQQTVEATWSSSMGEHGLLATLVLLNSHSGDPTGDFLVDLVEAWTAVAGRREETGLGIVLGVTIPDVLRLIGVGKADTRFELGVADVFHNAILELVVIPFVVPNGVL